MNFKSVSGVLSIKDQEIFSELKRFSETIFSHNIIDDFLTYLEKEKHKEYNDVEKILFKESFLYSMESFFAEKSSDLLEDYISKRTNRYTAPTQNNELPDKRDPVVEEIINAYLDRQNHSFICDKAERTIEKEKLYSYTIFLINNIKPQ